MNLNDNIGIEIRKLHLIISNYAKKRLEPFNLATEQSLILLMLWGQDGISPNKFVSQLNKDKASIARMIASLEGKGYIKKVDDPTDKRTFKVHLTDEGKQLESLVVPALQRTHKNVTAGITENELIELRRIFAKMTSNILEESYFKNS
ncbi:MarR family winged helix-turn-helix transcriptional regulator [Heyndrickxia acidicola]|uniref:MarR family transcriptional regulator n=1 Tax=Heyndrickxia acidicola TaxID=209389 RepID=A0ABU6MD93_9BACI|nr:MarR family transcriptional regulator [Heyndrickxia acidicola]MED1202624.1 MarR family transcriptional regulator [Heyndrickxia acidicola]